MAHNVFDNLTKINSMWFNNRCFLYSGECIEELWIMFPQSHLPVSWYQSEKFDKIVKSNKIAKVNVHKLERLAQHIFQGKEISDTDKAEGLMALSPNPQHTEPHKMYVSDKKVVQRAKKLGIAIEYKEEAQDSDKPHIFEHSDDTYYKPHNQVRLYGNNDYYKYDFLDNPYSGKKSKLKKNENTKK